MKKTIFATMALLIAFSFIAYTFVPTPSAARTPVQWEYTFFDAAGTGSQQALEALRQRMNGLGKEGWELSATVGTYLIFKRPLR